MSDDIFANLPLKAHELGTPLARLRNQPRLSLALTLSRAATRLLLAVGFLALGLRIAVDPARGDSTGWELMMGVAWVAGTMCLISAARVGWTALRQRRGSVLGVVHCPGGLVCVLPGYCIVVPWDEIDTIWDGGRRFRVRGGAEVTLPDTLECVPDLAEALYRETFQRMSVCASAMILGGRAVDFGPVTLTRDGIAVGAKRLAWPEVRGVVVMWGRLRILCQGGARQSLDVPVAEVPNVHALAALIERLRDGAFGSIVIGPGTSDEPAAE